MDIGFMSRDITPSPGIRLGGYGHRFGRSSTHIINRLKVNMLDIVNSLGEEVVLLQLDLLGLYRDDADKLRHIISRRVGVSSEAVMITTTHTHSAPETIIPMWRNTFPYSDDDRRRYEEWFRYMVEVVKDMSDEISLNRERVEFMKIGSTNVGNICYNRAFQDGDIDRELGLIYIESRSSRIAVVSYACHPVTNIGLGISSDYPGVIRDVLEGYGIKLIFLTGAAGDIDPISKGVRYMNYIGRILAYEIIKLISWSNMVYVNDIPISFTIHKEIFSLRKPERSINEVLGSYYTLLSQYSHIEDLYSDPNWIDLLYLDEEIDILRDSRNSVETVFQGIRIGSSIILGIPGELFSETSLSVKKIARDRYPYTNILISTYTNDYIGYIPTERAFRENRYEARIAKWSRVGEDAEPRTREILLNIIESIT